MVWTLPCKVMSCMQLTQRITNLEGTIARKDASMESLEDRLEAIRMELEEEVCPAPFSQLLSCLSYVFLMSFLNSCLSHVFSLSVVLSNLLFLE